MPDPLPTPAAEPAALAPVVEAAPAAIIAESPQVDASASTGDKGGVATATPPTSKEFAPSLLDEAAKTPTADPPKPDTKPVEAQPPAPKEPAAADAKPGEPAAPKPAEPPAPIEYAFTRADEKGERVPLGPDQIDPERLGAFTNVLQEARVAPEAAQKMLDLHVAELSRAVDLRDQRQWDVFANTQKEWKDVVMADPELGGSRHATAIRTVMGLIDAFNLRNGADGKARSAETVAAERQELMDVARVTGVANNPTWLRLLHWAGDRLTREPSARPAPPARTPTLTGQQRGLRRYEKTTPVNANGAG